ncbi:TetR/AcrR family transcriptional regulator [Brevibacterium sp. HMSC07C04]|nr:TetR/AcrR family transcriptional regulator [Brevibacterium sp. HMSC07C04]OFS26524.1 hypothetical protein HMPREF3162_05115 [Brevibacterium sp. HMSC07C04]
MTNRIEDAMLREGPARPRQQRSIATRAKLLDAAGRVFARLTFAEARLKDISKESGISSEGALFFHFGKKEDIAAAVIEAQQERMLSVLDAALESDLPAPETILRLADDLARLIADDSLVQGGIRLINQPSVDFPTNTSNPFFRWIDIVKDVIDTGKGDGSIPSHVATAEAAEVINAMFIGEQVLAGLADSWASLPARIERLHPYIRGALNGSLG